MFFPFFSFLFYVHIDYFYLHFRLKKWNRFWSMKKNNFSSFRFNNLHFNYNFLLDFMCFTVYFYFTLYVLFRYDIGLFSAKFVHPVISNFVNFLILLISVTKIQKFQWKKQNELIKHTFNKLASILTHAHFGERQCPRRQGTIYQYKAMEVIRKLTQIAIQPIRELDATKTTNTFRCTIAGAMRLR